jgi:bisphosphoglycerate-independent phosphoglycerate mutase (AlkP superfamily)
MKMAKKKEPIEANFSQMGQEVKVHLFIDGKDCAFRCAKSDLEKLQREEGEYIRKVSF